RLALGVFWATTKNAPAHTTSQPPLAQRLSRKQFFNRRIGRMTLVAYRRFEPDHTHRLWERSAVRRILWTQWVGTLLMGIAQLVPLAVLLLTLYNASEIKQDDYSSYLMVATEYAMCVALTGGILLTLALSPTHRKSWHLGAGMILFLPVVLSLLSQASGMLPMAVMQITKNGNFRAEKIILSPKTCESIAPLLGIECDAKSSKPVELCNVHVMTRVGPETYLRLPERKTDTKGKHRIQRIFIPTPDIAAMDINFDLKFLRLKKLDENLEKLGPECPIEITTLYGDSAFGFNGFTLADSGKKQLLQFIKNIKASSKNIRKINITGYADQIGTESYNAWLSARRADEIRIFMEKELKNAQAAVPLTVGAKGSADPIIKDCKKAKDRVGCEAPNRRVEVQIIMKDSASE
ncbi:MAG: OmpA family protein, partial [Methylomonas sp.]